MPRIRLPERPAGGVAARAVALAFTMVVGASAPLHSHGGRLPLEQWGGFEPAASRCQRAIAAAAAYCASRSWRLLRDCRSLQIAGNECDEQRTTSLINLARTTALDQVDELCTELDAVNLSFLGTFDLQADLIDFCRDWNRAAESAVFGPVLRGSPPPVPDEAEKACVAAAASATTRLMSFTFRIRRRAMDRIAVVDYPVDDEVGFYESASQQIDHARDVLADDLARACPEQQFAALYGKDPRTFLDDVGVRADCVGTQFYIQDRFLCPDGVCGNAVVDPREECDDGNLAAGDGCDSRCRSEG